MRRIRAPWSAEDDERLKTLVASGASALRAAADIRHPEPSLETWVPFPTIREVKKRIAERERSLD
jgi:hypothetical protein